MHWFLWLIFAWFSLAAVMRLTVIGGVKLPESDHLEQAIAAVCFTLLAVGVLIYGGIL